MTDTLIELAAKVDAALRIRAVAWPAKNQPPDLTQKLDRYVQAAAGAARALGPPSLNPELERTVADFQDHPVFIVGYYKSGTSLLRNLLDGHPRLVVLPTEGRYFSLFLPRSGRLSKAEQVERLGAIWTKRLIVSSGQPPYWLLGQPGDRDSCPYVQFLRYLHAWSKWVEGHGQANLLLAVALAYYTASHWSSGQTQAPRCWIEKTPTNEWRVDKILACFPQARFIHVTRDPRAVIAACRSIKEQQRPTNYHPFADVYLLRRSLKAGRRNVKALGPQRYHIVRYKDLVQEPGQTMLRVADFIGIQFDKSLTVPTVHGATAVANSAYEQSRVRGEIHRGSLNRYRQHLTPGELALVEGFTRREASAYGYEIETPSWRDYLPSLISAFLTSGWAFATKPFRHLARQSNG